MFQKLIWDMYVCLVMKSHSWNILILLHLGNSCNVIEGCVCCVCYLWERSVHKTVTLDLWYDSILAVIIKLPHHHLQHLSTLNIKFYVSTPELNRLCPGQWPDFSFSLITGCLPAVVCIQVSNLVLHSGIYVDKHEVALQLVCLGALACSLEVIWHFLFPWISKYATWALLEAPHLDVFHFTTTTLNWHFDNYNNKKFW